MKTSWVRLGYGRGRIGVGVGYGRGEAMIDGIGKGVVLGRLEYFMRLHMLRMA